jgi:predicted kinase
MKAQVPTVYLICGFIGAGKTTFAKQLEERTGAVRITKDEWSIRLIGNDPTMEGYTEWDRKITALTRDIALQLVEKKGLDIILDEGFWERRTRYEMRKRIEAIGAKMELYFLDTPIETIRERVLERNQHSSKESFQVGRAALDAYLKLWEPPSAEERFILVK